jgi:hypothetical protein
MLFKYKISLEIEAEFDAPLLGTDTTKVYRNQIDVIAKQTLAEMIRYKTTSFVGVDRGLSDDDLKGTVKGTITLRSAKMLEEDKKNGN